MSLVFTDLEANARSAVKQFWSTRSEGSDHQDEGAAFVGERPSVLGGKNLDGFFNLVKKIVLENGLPIESIVKDGKGQGLPGYFRATKEWDFLVIHKNELIAAIEFKSQVGSFGNNFNNRCEEAIGSAVDLRTAFREKAFGTSPAPFLGYLTLVEDCDESQKAVTVSSPHFAASADFLNASYVKRYELLCKKLVQESLYNEAALLLSKRTDRETGNYTEGSDECGLMRFATGLAGQVAAAAARK